MVNGPPMLTDLLIFAVVGVMVVHSYLLWRKGQWLLMNPLNLFWAGCVVCYVQQPLGLYHIISTWQTEETIDWTLFWCIFAILCVGVGYNLRAGVRLGAKLPRMPARLKQSHVAAWGLVLIGVGLFGYGYQAATVGGFNNWVQFGRGGTDWSQMTGYLTLLADFLPAGTLLILLSTQIFHSSTPVRVLAWCINVLMLLFLVYLGTRSRTIMYSMSMLAAWQVALPTERRRITVRSAVALLAIFLALDIVTKFQAYYRGSFTNLSFNLDQIDLEKASYRVLPHLVSGAESDPAEDARQSRGMEFNCVATVVNLVPSQSPYNYGYTMLELFTRPIPHSLWPGKRFPLLESQYPVMLFGQLSNSPIDGDGIHPMLAGPAFTYVGYWYHVAGAIGLIIGGFFTGAMFRTIQEIRTREPGNQGNILLYVTLLPIGFTEAAGTPFTWVFTLPFIFIPMIFIIYASRDSLESGSIPSGRMAFHAGVA